MLAHVFASRSLHWHLPATLSLVAAFILGTGCFLALTGGFGEPLAPMPKAAVAAAKSGAFRIVAVGDSITDGTGDARGGYAARVADTLRREGGLVTIFTNLAVGGQETHEILATINRAEARRELATADLILVSAGGNDLNHGLRANMRGEPREAQPGQAASDEPGWAPQASLVRARENLGKIVASLRAVNPGAAIRLLGIYNPFEIAAADAAEARGQLLEWNIAIERAALPHEGAVVVPIADLFAGRNDLLAGDRFHPGPKGHELIAERVLATLPPVATRR
jgi:lysophospholipase L1-like esterase